MDAIIIEYSFFGVASPLKAGDDSHMTHRMVYYRYDIVILYYDDASISHIIFVHY